MPSGQTHDRITLWSLPAVTGLTLAVTRSSNLALIVSGGFLFSGLMFSPDLDLRSRPFKRWGWLRWIWIPYQKVMRHRSFFSHGLLIGTTLRVLYLAVCFLLLAVFIVGIIQLFRDIAWSWQGLEREVRRSLFEYRVEWIALFVGLELGALSHSFSDWLGSTYKRFKRKGLRELQPQKVKPKKPRRKSGRVKRRNSQ